MIQGEATRYVGWQVLDRTGPRLLVSWVIAAAVCLPMHFALQHSQMTPRDLAVMARGMHDQFAWVAAIVIFHGIVAEDRTRGFFRFYLAKPVSPIWFYGQSHVLAVLAMVSWSAGFIGLFSLAVRPIWDWSLVASGLAMGLLLGGLLFFFSTVTARDWVVTLGVALIASLLRARFPRADGLLGKAIDAGLPPTHLIGVRLSAWQWVWLGVWSVALVIAGLAVLRRRPLGED